MATEIERKFLVSDTWWRNHVHESMEVRQGYISDMHSGATVRVRISGSVAFITIKSNESGCSRLEFEYDIPVEEARELMALCTFGRIEKHRHLVRHVGHLWEIDEFLGDNAGLVVAEIELNSVDEHFERPSWLGDEVTHDSRYFNLALASNPYGAWPRESAD